MPFNFSIKNVPDALALRLRERAERNHRSLQRELMAILEWAAAEPPFAPRHAPPVALDTPARRVSIEELSANARKLFPNGTPSSVQFIREMRDGRYGAHWARTGKHRSPR